MLKVHAAVEVQLAACTWSVIASSYFIVYTHVSDKIQSCLSFVM